jgi:hypothetical protein
VITIESSGSFKKTEDFLNSMSKFSPEQVFTKYALDGVAALSQATPIDSNETASSWSYEIEVKKESTSIFWTNDVLTSEGTPVAILLQYGHATGTGGYVQGLDYINPAIKPIFDEIANNVWNEVRSA